MCSRRALFLAVLAAAGTATACGAGTSSGSATGSGTSAVGPTHSISGEVTGGSGVTVSVTLSGLTMASVLTDASGRYSLGGLPAGDYEVTASKVGYAFLPPSRDVAVSVADVPGLDFAGAIITYAICGKVDGGAGATVRAASNGAISATGMADASGNYCIGGLLNGLYNVTPSMDGYTFSPASQNVAVSGADAAGKNFTARLIKYAISGTVTGASYATVTLSANGADVETTTTDASGYYIFADLAKGPYAVRASADGYAFNPVRREVALSGADVPAQDFAAGEWRWQNPLPQGNTLNGIWGSGANDVWAVGDGGTILHWGGGGAWARVPSGSTAHLHAVWGSSSSDLWAVGSGGTTLHWDGSVWMKVPSGSTAQLNGLWGSGSGDVWAVGAGGTILRWNGSTWQDAGKNGGSANVTTIDLNGVWGSTANDVWAVGQFDLPAHHRTLLHWDGSAWASVDLELTAGNFRYDLTSIWGSGPDIWVSWHHIDDNAWLMRWNGTGWSPGAPAQHGRYFGIWGIGPNDFWTVGTAGATLHAVRDSQGNLSFQPMPSGVSCDLHGVWGSAANDVWAVGEAGTILHWDGSAWTSVSSGPVSMLNGIHGMGADDAWAVGWNGAVLHWTGGAWTAVSTQYTIDLNDVWTTKVDGVDQVWAVGPYGVILHGGGAGWSLATSGSNSLTGVWGSGPHDIWAVGAGGTIAHGDGTDWEPVPSGTASTLNGVWARAVDDAWAVGAGGTILRWNGGGWSAVESGTKVALRGVWGVSATDVWAVGEAGVILHWDGAAWSGVSSGIANDLLRVWGNWSSDVWAVGTEGVILRWDGTSWNAVTSGTGNTLNAVWGSGPTDVHVVGDIGTILGWR